MVPKKVAGVKWFPKTLWAAAGQLLGCWFRIGQKSVNLTSQVAL
jgi:hypothetical protein